MASDTEASAGPDLGDPGPAPAPPRAWWDLRGSIALVVALAFLAGAAGYALGVASLEEAPAGAVDVGFLVDMSHHHEQGVAMAITAVDKASDPTVRKMAVEVIAFQQRDLGAMRAFAAERGIDPIPGPGDDAMAWMGMTPVPTAAMPGMASEADLARLDELEGEAFDLLWLELMAAHHEGGQHMADYAAQNAGGEDVRSIARYMSDNQAIEAREYRNLIERTSGGG